MRFLRPAVRQQLLCPSHFPGQPLHQCSHSHCSINRYCLLGFLDEHFPERQTDFLDSGAGWHFPPGPCDPVNVTSILQCGSDVATVSWVESAGAVTHVVLAQEEGSQVSCRSNTTSCQLKQLQCGKVYNLMVLGEDATCNSTGGTNGTLMTG